MDWFTTAIADGATLDVLLARIDVEIQAAVDSESLPHAAAVYAVPSGQYVRLYFNGPAIAVLPAIAGLAFRPTMPPHERDMVHPLIRR